MSLAGTAAKLLASLDLDTKPFEAGQKRVNRDLGSMETRFQRVSTKSLAIGSAIGTGIERLAEKGIGALFSNLSKGEESLNQLNDIQAQTAGVIQSTGGKAKISAAQVRALAQAQEDISTVDDKVVQSGENMLLTFTNIGQKAFPQATKAIVDMAVAMNGGNAEGVDLKSTAIQVGKALNDPVKGFTALQRVGVTFSADQKKRIKELVKEGDLYGAQKVILDELSKEFGKAGEAAGKSGAAGVRRLNDAVEDSQIALAQGLAPALDRIRTKIAEGLTKPSTQAAIRHLGEWLGDAAEKGLAFAESIPWDKVADGLKTAAGFAGGLIDTFTHMPPQAQAAILGLAGLNKLAGGGVIKVGVDLFESGAKGLLGQFFQRGSPANPMFVVSEGGGLGGAAGAAGAGGGIGALGKTALLAEGVVLLDLVNQVKDNISAGLGQQAQQVGSNLTTNLERNPQTIGTLSTQLDAINTGIDRIESNPLNVLVGGQALDELKSMRTQVTNALDKAKEDSRKNLQPLPEKITAKQKSSFDALRDRLESTRVSTVQRLSTVEAATRRVENAELNGSAAIVRAIQQQQLKVNLTLSLRAAGLSAYQSATFLSRATRLETKGIT